jgi:hypothetical protein
MYMVVRTRIERGYIGNGCGEMEIAENGGFFQRSKWVGWGNWDVKTSAAGDKNCSLDHT